MHKQNHQNCLTERLRLEPIASNHTDDLLRLHSDPAIAKWYGGKWSAEQAQAFALSACQAWQSDGVHKWIAYERTTDALVGRGGLSICEMDGKKQVEIGWALLGRFWGYGYATEIGQAGLDYAFNVLGVQAVIATTESHNQNSRAVMERLGMTYIRDFAGQGLIEGREGVHDGATFVLYRIKN